MKVAKETAAEFLQLFVERKHEIGFGNEGLLGFERNIFDWKSFNKNNFYFSKRFSNHMKIFKLKNKKFTAENIYHIYNQGNNRQLVFNGEDDYLIFLRLISGLVKPHAEIIAWCLMPNHFHLLVYTYERSAASVKQGGLMIDALTNSIRKLLSSYARIFHKKCQRTGSLFRQKTKSKNLFEAEAVMKNTVPYADYCRATFCYIHQNPVAAQLVQHPKDWKWSSYLDYAGVRKGKLVNKELTALYCG